MKILKYTLLVVFAAVCLFPYYWMLITAFSKYTWISEPQIIPFPLYWGAFKEVLFNNPFLKWLLNTFIISIATTVGSLFFSVLAGFSFACLRYRFRDLIFYILLSTMILPGFLMVIPRFFLVVKMGGLNTYWGVIIPMWFSVFNVFLLRQYFFSMPHSILNAARVDGASLWQIFWRLAVPFSKPVLFALFVISFIGGWNSFLWPLLILRKTEMRTLTIGMSTFYSIYYQRAGFNYIMAGAVLSLLPIFVMFILFSRYVQKGLNMRITF